MREKLTRVGDLVKLLVRHGGSGILTSGGSDQFLTDEATTGGATDGPEKLAADLEAQRARIEQLKALSLLDRLLGRHKGI